jgi:hypothetical protein
MEFPDELHQLIRQFPVVLTCDLHVGIPAVLRAIEWYVERVDVGVLSKFLLCLWPEATRTLQKKDHWQTCCGN